MEGDQNTIKIKNFKKIRYLSHGTLMDGIDWCYAATTVCRRTVQRCGVSVCNCSGGCDCGGGGDGDSVAHRTRAADARSRNTVRLVSSHRDISLWVPGRQCRPGSLAARAPPAASSLGVCSRRRRCVATGRARATWSTRTTPPTVAYAHRWRPTGCHCLHRSAAVCPMIPKVERRRRRRVWWERV